MAKKTGVKLAAGLLLIFWLLGCSTPLRESLKEVQPGMDKDDVLELAGSPWTSRRVGSTDNWVYRIYKGDTEYRKIIVFQNGHVREVQKPRRYPDPNNVSEDVLDASTMKSYKKAVKKEHEQFEKGFRDVESTD